MPNPSYTLMNFTVAGGTPGAITASGSPAPTNGNYQIAMKQDETGWTLVLTTPVGVIQADNVMHSGTD